jgi:hypothetical protein
MNVGNSGTSNANSLFRKDLQDIYQLENRAFAPISELHSGFGGGKCGCSEPWEGA